VSPKQLRKPKQQSLLPQSKADPLAFERRFAEKGYQYIAGVDEAGRGCLAGPVVAASVILPQGLIIEGLKDSKQLSAKKRDEMYDRVCESAIAWSWSAIDAPEIDRINILRATLVAMRESVEKLKTQPDFLLIDGRDTIQSAIPQKAISKGDVFSHSVAAASVIAKVTRDRMMCEHAKTHPSFSFHIHKGYGTKLHLDELSQNDPTPLHRMTFRRVLSSP